MGNLVPGSRSGAHFWPLAAVIPVVLVGCGGSSSPMTTEQLCTNMLGATVAASSIGLATQGAKVVSAMPIAAKGTGGTAVGGFCRLTAEIAPVDTAAPPIKMELNLPDSWNGKALMYGGGGYNGAILSTAGTVRLQPAGTAIPLGRGYVTFGSDSGHSGTSSDGSFAVNDEALRNYAFEALKKTRDVATVLTQRRYGQAISKLYFHGSSNGGREALAMVHKYPNDIDGAMVFWPATMLGTAEIQFGRIARALNQPGATPNLAKRKLLQAASLQACDTLDGAADGVISQSAVCQKTFDPSTAVFNGRALRCSSGADEGDSCLSDAQIGALKVIGSPVNLPYSVASGQTQYPGYNVWGGDLGTSTADTVSNTITSQGLGTAAPGFPTMASMPFIHNFADQYIKYFVTRTTATSWTQVDPSNPGGLTDRLSQLTGLLDMSSTDLSAFRARGGKLIVLHGTADQLVPVQASEQYVRAVTQTMGASATAGFLKFYELPGVAHSGVGTAFTPTWDALGALDDWVLTGTAPAAPVITDTYASPGRTRPLCEYPQYPRYVSGSLELAASFRCSN